MVGENTTAGLVSDVQKHLCKSHRCYENYSNSCMKVLLNVPALYYISTHKVCKIQPPISHSYRANYRKSNVEIIAGPLTGLPSDTMVRKINFKDTYTVIMPNREK